MAQPQKQKKIFLRSNHFENMTITFSTSNTFEGTVTVVGLKVDGSEAIDPVTEDGTRSIVVSLNPGTHDLVISETRFTTGGKMRKAVELLSGTYTVLQNEIQEGNTWLMVLQSSIPIHIQNGIGDCGELHAAAMRMKKHDEAKMIAAQMSKSLALGKQELWFAQRTVNHVEIRVPDCHNSKLVDIDEVVKAFDNFKAAKPQADPTPASEECTHTEFGWVDEENVRVRTGSRVEERSGDGERTSDEEVPENWFDDLE